MNGPFRGASAAAIAARIDDACISEEDKRIVRMRVIHRMKWVEIGAELNCDRRTAARHFKDALDQI